MTIEGRRFKGKGISMWSWCFSRFELIVRSPQYGVRKSRSFGLKTRVMSDDYMHILKDEVPPLINKLLMWVAINPRIDKDGEIDPTEGISEREGNEQVIG